jgi:hypothetical protein
MEARGVTRTGHEPEGMLVLAAHNHHHVGPALLGFLAFLGSIGLGLYLVVTLSGTLHRTLAVLAALSLAAVSYAPLKSESDTWWKRRCERNRPGQPRYIKPGCGTTPPVVPFMAAPSD